MNTSPGYLMLLRLPSKVFLDPTFETATPEARAWVTKTIRDAPADGHHIPIDSDLEGERLFPDVKCIVPMLLHAKRGHDVTDPRTDPAPRTPEQEQASAEFWAFLRIHDVNADGTFTLAVHDLTPEHPLYMSPEAIERVKERLQAERLASVGTALTGFSDEAMSAAHGDTTKYQHLRTVAAAPEVT